MFCFIILTFPISFIRFSQDEKKRCITIGAKNKLAQFSQKIQVIFFFLLDHNHVLGRSFSTGRFFVDNERRMAGKKTFGLAEYAFRFSRIVGLRIQYNMVQ